MSEKMSHEEFIKKAIVSLRKEGYKGIHTVYSGFNEAFKKYFEGENKDFVDKFKNFIFFCIDIYLFNICFFVCIWTFSKNRRIEFRNKKTKQE